MADISQINLPNDNNNPYNLTDSTLPHSSLEAEIDGTDLSLVTTGEKYNWNRQNNVLPGYLISTYRSYASTLPITTKAGNVYVSSNKDIQLSPESVKNIKTITAVFGFSYVTDSTNSSATWIGIQSAYIDSSNNFNLNYIIYKHSSATVKNIRMCFIIIGTT